jgi:hypothetical protein
MMWVRPRRLLRDNGFDSGDVIVNEVNEVVRHFRTFEKGGRRVWWQLSSPRFRRKTYVD